MLWKTHIRISNEVLRRLNVNLSSEVYDRFKEGVLAPDVWKYYPHHYSKTGAIQTNLQNARQYFLQDNHMDAFYYLGVALHYIQDAYTTVISYNSPNNQEWHHNYEQSIEDSDFVYNIENTLQYFFQNDSYQLNRFSSIGSELSQKVEGRYETLRIATLVGKTQSQQTGKPKVDLNLALKACTIISESVIGQKNYSPLDLSIKDSLNKHQHLLHEAEIYSSIEIISFATQVEALKAKRIIKLGFVVKIKNGILSLRVKLKELQLKNKYNSYIQKKHLLKVNDRYADDTSEIISPHIGWYNYFVPKLDFGLVKKEIIPVQQVSETFGIKAETVSEIVNSHKIRVHSIGNQAVIARKELKHVLS